MTDIVRVIMPIGSDPDFKRKQTAIARGARAAGFEAAFPDYDPVKPRFDLDSVVKQLRTSTVVLADLTGERPSCYYELGLAEALGRPVALLAAKGSDIHQTYFRARARFYDGLSDLEALTASVLRALDHEHHFHAAE
jgi:nucleoside 2-deoxyribosyltransferase